MFVIEKNVPIPGKNSRPGGIADTIRRLEVGDSFVTQATDRPNVNGAASRAGVKITVRIEPVDMIRVWRIA